MAAPARILCIDDDATGLLLRQKVLQLSGYDVLTAASGQDALQVLASIPQFDLIIVDFMMPDMDGALVSAAIKARFPRMPILMLSALVHVPETARESIDMYMNKGGDPRLFLGAVRQLTIGATQH